MMILGEDGKELKTGYTTGSCATAGALAAMLLLTEQMDVPAVAITLPSGDALQIPVEETRQLSQSSAMARIIKDAGEDADVTHGLDIIVTVTLDPANQMPPYEEVVIRGGKGVGTVTKTGLQIAPGEAAINPVPRQMIGAHVRRYLPEGMVATVTVSVPEGEKVAKKTFNPRLGIEGGISIIGTSGIVRPMSDDAYKATIHTELKQKRALGETTVILVPGLHGEKYAQGLGYESRQVVHMGNFIGFSIQSAEKLGFEKMLLIGHSGKLMKVAGGIFNTHSRVADAKAEILITELALMSAPLSLIEAVLMANTTDEMSALLEATVYFSAFQNLTEKAKAKVKNQLLEETQVDIVIYSMPGKILGDTREKNGETNL
ncbi:MAG: cobalamin biosynthesis protein CbiD [Clostridiales bacterium 38-18]|nr:MAG: cobalamin biosynthesis protein CbiD [Clostridiales bacterium 38-18]